MDRPIGTSAKPCLGKPKLLAQDRGGHQGIHPVLHSMLAIKQREGKKLGYWSCCYHGYTTEKCFYGTFSRLPERLRDELVVVDRVFVFVPKQCPARLGYLAFLYQHGQTLRFA